MLSKKEFILIGCTIINAIIFSIIVSNLKIANILSVSANLGDTVSGISGLIIGLWSIYLLFETYNAQRQANIESRSLNLFSTIIDELNVAKEYLYSIEYESNNGLVQGKNAVLFFKHSLHNISPGLNGMPEVAIESRKIWSNCTGYDRYIIKHILEFLKKIIFVAEKVQSSELIQVHTLSCKWHMLNLMEEYFNSYDEIPQLIVDSLQGASSNKDDYSFYAAHDVNYFVQQIIDYFSCIHRLQELSVVELNNAETVSIDEYFAKPDIDIELIKGFFGQRRKVKKG